MKTRGIIANKRNRGARPLRVDPTYTGGIRKRFTSKLARMFAELRADIIRLIRDENAIGIRPEITAHAKTDYTRADAVADAVRALYDVAGRDTSIPYADIEATLAQLNGLSKPELLRVAERMELAGMRSKQPDAIREEIMGKIKNRRGGTQRGEMIFADDINEKRAAAAPGVTDWRQKHERAVEILAAPKAVTSTPVPPPMIQPPAPIPPPQSAPSIPVENPRWQFRTDPQKVQEFQAWLKERLGARVTGADAEKLWEEYVKEGFEKGANRAFTDATQKEKHKAAREEKLDFYDGTREQFLRTSFGQPESVGKVKLLAARSFNDLQGITEEMSRRMSRTLVDGLAQGEGPREIARDLVADVGIGKKRAETIARTEIIRAHAEGQLTAFAELGVEELGVMVEWLTAGDGKVCPKCKALEGKTFKIDEARGMLPRHPRCRCSWTVAFAPGDIA